MELGGFVSSPTQRTLKHLRKTYPLVQVVEKWIPRIKRRIDLFGIGDVLAVGDDIVVVQTTSASNMAARVTKITESDTLPILRKAGIRVLVHGWRKNSKGRWVLREVDVS